MVFNEIVESFPEFKFTFKKLKRGNTLLRLRNYRDVSKFIKTVKPHLRIFTNVRRAIILEDIVDFILEKMHGKHYGSEEHFGFLLSRIAELRKYSKRSVGIKHHNIGALLGREVEGKNVEALIEESKSYIPNDFNNEYLAGLFDAEGYVGLCFQRNPRATFGRYLRPYVNLNLAIYDAGVLFKLREKFTEFNPRIKIRKSNNTAYFQIDTLDGVEGFIKTLYPFSKLPTMKSRLSLILDAIEIIRNKTHYSENDWNKLLKIREELKANSKRR